MTNLKLTLLAALILTAQTAFAQSLSKKCIDEFKAIPDKKANFDFQSFLKDLTAEVVKVNAQLKLPFGKPADGKVTDIGVTVGCLKALPEKPEQIKALFKDIGLETTKNIVTNKLEATPAKTEAQRINIASSTPALKECDVVFNPSKKFCYDGEAYDLCDGMPYNPTTHICSGELAYRALCNGIQYNPLTQKCENNIILAVCGTISYDSTIYGCCNNTIYVPSTYGCKNNAVFAFIECGEIFYNPETHGCIDNTVLPKCGETIYNPATHGCKDNAISAFANEEPKPEIPKTLETTESQETQKTTESTEKNEEGNVFIGLLVTMLFGGLVLLIVFL